MLHDTCPYCYVALKHPDGKVTSGCSLAICPSCTNLIAMAKCYCGQGVYEVGTVPRKWFLASFTEEQRAEIHEQQELVAFQERLYG